VRARAHLEVGRGGRIRWSAAPPVVLRRTGADRVHLVQAAGGPLGGDELELRIALAEGTTLTVESSGATVAQPGRPGSGPAHWTVRAELAEGARLRWTPRPTVVCDGARLHARLRVELAEGSGALLREEVRLGRHGQLGGHYRGELSVDQAGEPLLRHTTLLDGTDPGLVGPAGTGGQRVAGTLLGAGTEPEPETGPVGEQLGTRWGRSRLAGPGWLLLAVGPDAAGMSALLDRHDGTRVPGPAEAR
jgi:urease accessory protein